MGWVYSPIVANKYVMVFKFLKGLFKRPRKIKLSNWSLLSYTGAIFNIIETASGNWSINVSLFLTKRDIENEFALIVPLVDALFEDYMTAFTYIKQMEHVFIRTLSDVIVINKEGKKVQILNLKTTSPKLPIPINQKTKKSKYQHSGNQTIN